MEVYYINDLILFRLIILGCVGIRCVFCKDLPDDEKAGQHGEYILFVKYGFYSYAFTPNLYTNFYILILQ